MVPSCEADGEKARKVKAVADKAVWELRERRAEWECGDRVAKDGSEIVGAGIGEVRLKEMVGAKRRKGMSQLEFEELWKGAIGEVLGREEVTGAVDG